MAKTGYNKYTGKPTNPANFYVNPQDLQKEIIKSQKQKACTNELAIMCQKIMDNVIKWPRFRYKPQDLKDEMMSFAWFRFLKNDLYNINPNKNCFCYITTGFYLNCLKRAETLHKKAINELKLKQKMMEEIKNRFGSQYIDENSIYEENEENED